ncbi:MAG: TonB-dependent receptor, partial [Aldersonia sp.]|nr:TonB-dependent receptor [Aldersonia sp.]
SAQLTGFAPARAENVLVRSGQTASVPIALRIGGVTEQVQVTAESPTVDVTTATTGQDITLQLTESLPTGRSYQSYLQLVPGVLPDDPQTAGNPAAKSGLNYSDIAGALGVSSDNFYYFNGINVTDPVTGTFGANLNTEIIQEQRVLTGGIPAEFVGTPGLLSSVITKTGTNIWNGSLNYFFQKDNLVAENKNSPSENFGTFDAAGTIGGPIVQNKAWFFGSYRRVEREDDVTSLDTRQLLRTVSNEQDQGYFKTTWTPTAADTLAFTFLNDPTNISGRRDRTLTNARDRRREQGGNNYSGNYSRLMGGLLVDAALNWHEGEVSDFSAINQQSNTVIFRGTDTRTLFNEQIGGWGQAAVDRRDTKGVRATATWNIGRHTAKGGVEWSRNENFRNTTYINDALEWSFAPHLSGITGTQLAAGGLSTRRFNPSSVSDFGGLISSFNASPNRAAYYAQFDVDGNGTITSAELASRLTFTTPNPNGGIYYARNFETQEGPQDLHSDGASFFVQDQFS